MNGQLLLRWVKITCILKSNMHTVVSHSLEPYNSNRTNSKVLWSHLQVPLEFLVPQNRKGVPLEAQKSCSRYWSYEDEMRAPQNWYHLNCMVQENGKPLCAYCISIFMSFWLTLLNNPWTSAQTTYINKAKTFNLSAQPLAKELIPSAFFDLGKPGS